MLKKLREIIFQNKESEETKMNKPKVLATITDEEADELNLIKNQVFAAHSMIKTIQKNLAELQCQKDKWWDSITTKYELDPNMLLEVNLDAKTISKR